MLSAALSSGSLGWRARFLSWLTGAEEATRGAESKMGTGGLGGGIAADEPESVAEEPVSSRLAVEPAVDSVLADTGDVEIDETLTSSVMHPGPKRPCDTKLSTNHTDSASMPQGHSSTSAGWTMYGLSSRTMSSLKLARGTM